jgi:signal peptidase II
MFYFPIIDTTWPQWMPFVGGDSFVFFSPIFNFADASISCGIVALFVFYSKYLNDSLIQSGLMKPHEAGKQK